MRTNILKIIFTLMFLIMEIGLIKAQSLNNLEKKYEQMNISFDKENIILDSLRNIFTYKTAQIDVEKKKKNSDNERIIELMSGSVATSNKIEAQNKKIINLVKDIEKIKQQLHRLYTVKIDSLESLKKNKHADEDKIDAEILLLTEKNIRVAPKILSLSFNPEKIIEIDLNKTKDPKEKKLYREYLDNALNEVNSLLENVSSQVSEVDQIVALQTKTRKFLEETELESNMIIQSQRNFNVEADATSTPEFTERDGITTSSDFVSNVRTYQLILRQLDIQQLSKTDLKLKMSFEEINRNLDVKEYQKLLNEVKDRLQEFKLVLANKIGSSK